MIRPRHAFAATLMGLSLCNIALVTAQTTQASQPTKAIPAGRKFAPPLKGQAEVQFLQPITKHNKGWTVTTIRVKNVSNGSIDGLTIEEVWTDKSGHVVTSTKHQLKQSLEPGSIETIKIETPYTPKMNSNNYQFTHVNGTVKPHKVKSFDEEDKLPRKTAENYG